MNILIVVNLHRLPPTNNLVEHLEHVKIAVYDKNKITDNSQNWIELCFLERLHIKWKKPELNYGIKATKNLFYFLNVINVSIVTYSLDYAVFNF